MIAAPGKPDAAITMVQSMAERRERRASICRWLLRLHRLRPAAAAGALSAEALRALAPNAYHEILLDLYLAEVEDRPIYQSALAGSGPPVSTHRQVARLEALGTVTRMPDASDQRRLNVTLTPGFREVFEQAIDTLAAEARRDLSDWI